MTSPQHDPTIREVLDSIDTLGKPSKPSKFHTTLIVLVGIFSAAYLWILGISGLNPLALWLLGLLVALAIVYWFATKNRRIRKSRYQYSILRKPRWWFWLVPFIPFLVLFINLSTENFEGLTAVLVKVTIAILSITWGVVASASLWIEAQHPGAQSHKFGSAVDRHRHG